MPRFLVLLYGEEERWDAAGDNWHAENARRHRAFVDVAKEAVLTGGELARSAQAVSIRSDPDGRPRVAPGPFVTTPAGIGGYYLLEADSIDAASALARNIPEASSPGSGVEIRPVNEPSLPR
jgi:hypothetical protein